MVTWYVGGGGGGVVVDSFCNARSFCDFGPKVRCQVDPVASEVHRDGGLSVLETAESKIEMTVSKMPRKLPNRSGLFALGRMNVGA